MSIKSGQRYKITNSQAKLVVDLSGQNNKSIIGWKSHGGENQQWILKKQDNGQWTIQSVRGQKYLGFEKIPGNGTPLVGLGKLQTWDIEILNCDDPAKISVKLRVSGTNFVADFSLDKQIVGTGLQLWTCWGGKNQTWVLEERKSLVAKSSDN
ncbi:carbohydrate-binding module family 13 protein [Lactarius tabidus]